MIEVHVRYWFRLFVWELKVLNQDSVNFLQPFLLFLLLLFVYGITASQTQSSVLSHITFIWIAYFITHLVNAQYYFEEMAQTELLNHWVYFSSPLFLHVFIKLLAHLVVSSLVILLILPIVMYTLDISFGRFFQFFLLWVLAECVFVSLAAFGSVLSLTLRNHSLVLAIIMFPFYIPTLLLAILATNDLGLSSLSESFAFDILMIIAVGMLTFMPFLVASCLRFKVER